MESFVIVLKNDRIRWYNRLDLLITFLNGLYSVYFLLNVIRTGNYIALAGGILFSFIAIAFNTGSAFHNRQPLVPFSIVFILFAIQWACLYSYWLSLAFLVLAFLDIISRRKPTVTFFAENIEWPSFPKRTIAWDELNNVILKDNILTIDFKSDRLIQSEIAIESRMTDEKEFNDFCRHHLMT